MVGRLVLRAANQALSNWDNRILRPLERHYMNDVENKTAEQLATEINSPQNEQADLADNRSYSPDGAQSTREELILGKFKSVDDLAAGYQELERSFTASRQRRETPVQQPAAAREESQFDSDTVTGIKSILKAELEQDRASKFAHEHQEELADPILRGAVLLEIREANERGEYMRHEDALKKAKTALEQRLQPKVEAASKESFDEGKNLARRKEQAGAIGSVSGKATEVDPNTLNADDYAAYYGLERSF